MMKPRGEEDQLKERSYSKNTHRPETPHINLFKSNQEDIQVRNIKKGNESESLIKNFSLFMKQIIDTQNENFLNGDTKVVEFLISKYLNIEIEEIKKLEKLSIKINSDFGLLNQFGEYLTNLKELKLSNSIINSIQEVGTSFKNLNILHINNCNLKELSGIICLTNLEILDASDNSISDLIELEMCTSFKKINLRNNLIQNEENISFLGNLTELKWLNLSRNPICSLINYEELIKEALPELETLDKDEDLIIENKKLFGSQSTFTSSPGYNNSDTNIAKLTTEFVQENKSKEKIQGINSLRVKVNRHTEHIVIDEPNNQTTNSNMNKFKLLEDANNSPSRVTKEKEKIDVKSSPIRITKEKTDKLSNTTTGFFKSNLNDQPILRPVIIKKEIPLELKKPILKSREIEEDLAEEITKKLNKSKIKETQTNSFKVGMLKKNSDELSPNKLESLSKTQFTMVNKY